MGIARLFTDAVTVATRTGTKNGVVQFADPVTRTVFLNDSRKQVRDSTGVEVVSSTTLYDEVGAVDIYTPGSKVTANGHTAFVLCTYRRDSAGPVSAHHTQVDLT